MALKLEECLLLDRLKDRKMTQSDFAKRMECSRQYVSALARGTEFMSLEFAINAADILHCRVTDLYVLTRSRSRKG